MNLASENLDDDDLDLGLHGRDKPLTRRRIAKSAKPTARTHEPKVMQERLSDDYGTDEHNSYDSSSSPAENDRARVKMNMDEGFYIIGVKKPKNKVIDLTYDEEEKMSSRTTHHVPTNSALTRTSKSTNTRVKLEFSCPSVEEIQTGDSIGDKRKRSHHGNFKYNRSRHDNENKTKKDKRSNDGDYM